MHSFNCSNTWCLARLLPLMIGNSVPEGDPNWDHFLLLLKIADYILSLITSRSIAALLTTLIEAYHQSFKELYPECPIIPKQHYMVHIPQWMIRYTHSVHGEYSICYWPFFFFWMHSVGVVLQVGTGACTSKRRTAISKIWHIKLRILITSPSH